MFKKIKENPYYVKFKEMRANPKLKPITSLVLWFIFIVVLIIFVRGLPSNSSSASVQKKIISNYKFTYKNNNLVIFGESYDGKMEFFYQNNRYYYNEENVYLINEQNATLINNFDLNVLKIDFNFINNLISNLDYNLNGDFKEYVVPLSRFLNLYDVDVPINLSLANQYNIIVRIYENDNRIYKYQFDLTGYYNYKGLNNEGLLNIDIYGEVNDFTKYYDKLVGGVV